MYATKKSQMKMEDLYEDYLKQHKKDLKRLTSKQRKKVFLETQVLIDKQKEKHEKKESLFYLRHNHFSDATADELDLLFPIAVTFIAPNTSSISLPPHLRNPSLSLSAAAPARALDWSRSSNPLARAVLPAAVADQGLCGACWAFSASQAAAAAIFLTLSSSSSSSLSSSSSSSSSSFSLSSSSVDSSEPLLLSAQQLIDCDNEGLNNGCQGGNPSEAYKYIISHGLALDSKYPFTSYRYSSSSSSFQSESQDKCRKNIANKPAAAIEGFANIPSGREDVLERVLSELGPVSVGVCGRDGAFLLYGGGVFDQADCCVELNHAMLLTGFGHDDKTNTDYWIAKNSWGERWGEKGFMRIKRGTGGMGLCSILSIPSVPLGGYLFKNNSTFTSFDFEEQINEINHWVSQHFQDIIYAAEFFMILSIISLIILYSIDWCKKRNYSSI